MAKAFEKNDNLPLPERIIEVLRAAEKEGGDIRGKQSAALLIVDGKKTDKKWEDPLIDLRVDDHQQPLKELSRLLQIYRAYEHMNKGDLAIEHNNMDLALKEYSSAQTLFPNNIEMKFWTAVSLANNDQLEHSIPIFANIFNQEPNWRLLLERLVKPKILKISFKDLQKILSI